MSKKELRRTVWTVGANLHKQVGADWALPSCRMAITSTPRYRAPVCEVLARPVCYPFTDSAELFIVYHKYNQVASIFPNGRAALEDTGCSQTLAYRVSSLTLLTSSPTYGKVKREAQGKRRGQHRWRQIDRYRGPISRLTQHN